MSFGDKNDVIGQMIEYFHKENSFQVDNSNDKPDEIYRKSIGKMCIIKDNNLIINYKFFKLIAHEETYPYILSFVIQNIHNILQNNPTFNVHFCLKTMTLTQISKHYNFIINSCEQFKNIFPDKLNQCYLYNCPFMFDKIHEIISLFLDKKTRGKIIKV